MPSSSKGDTPPCAFPRGGRKLTNPTKLLDPAAHGHRPRNFRLVVRGVTRYTCSVMRSFRHKGIERFFRTGSKAGIQAAHAPRLARQLAALDVARQPSDMNVPGWGLHPLKGKLSNHWSVSVSGSWRLTFAFDDGDAELVDYQDCH